MIMGEKSHYESQLRRYIQQQGLSREAAEKAVLLDELRAAGSIAPFVSGVMLHGASWGMRMLNDAQILRQMQELGPLEKKFDPDVTPYTEEDFRIAQSLQEDAPRSPFTMESQGGIMGETDVGLFNHNTRNKYFKDTQLKTEPNTAYFWSGKSNGVGGPQIAAEIARSNGGVTLETTLESQNINMPKWDFNDSDAIQAWRDASATYAKQASGEVRAIIGSDINPDGIWTTIELPTLKSNPNVSKIIIIDPETRHETIIFTR